MTTINTNTYTSSPTHTGRSFFTAVRLAFIAHKQRKQLLALNETSLNDIGLTSADVAAEVSRAPWDVPQNWLR